MKKLNNKGFTLIELLAVVVIMGILMIVAIPAVTKYINNSKKDVFADNALAYINAARYSLLNDEYSCQAPSEGETVYVPLDIIELDKDSNKSTYGKNYNAGSYVKATNSDGKIVYSICLSDEGGNGTIISKDNKEEIGEVEESNLVRKSIATNKTTKSCPEPQGEVTTCAKPGTEGTE